MRICMGAPRCVQRRGASRPLRVKRLTARIVGNDLCLDTMSEHSICALECCCIAQNTPIIHKPYCKLTLDLC